MSEFTDIKKIEEIAKKYPQTTVMYSDFPGGWRGYQQYKLKEYCVEKCGKASDPWYSREYLKGIESELQSEIRKRIKGR